MKGYEGGGASHDRGGPAGTAQNGRYDNLTRRVFSHGFGAVLKRSRPAFSSRLRRRHRSSEKVASVPFDCRLPIRNIGTDSFRP